MWKLSYLIGRAFSGKNFPRNPKEASSELFPKPKTIPMPEVLKKKIRKEQNNGQSGAN